MVIKILSCMAQTMIKQTDNQKISPSLSHWPSVLELVVQHIVIKYQSLKKTRVYS